MVLAILKVRPGYAPVITESKFIYVDSPLDFRKHTQEAVQILNKQTAKYRNFNNRYGNIRKDRWVKSIIDETLDITPMTKEQTDLLLEAVKFYDKAAKESVDLHSSYNNDRNNLNYLWSSQNYRDTVKKASTSGQTKSSDCLIYAFETTLCPLGSVSMFGLCVPVAKINASDLLGLKKQANEHDSLYSRKYADLSLVCEKMLRLSPLNAEIRFKFAMNCGNIPWKCALNLSQLSAHDNLKLQTGQAMVSPSELCIPNGRQCPLNFMWDKNHADICVTIGEQGLVKSDRNKFKSCDKVDNLKPVTTVLVSSVCPVRWQSIIRDSSKYVCQDGIRQITVKNVKNYTNDIALYLSTIYSHVTMKLRTSQQPIVTQT